MKDVSRREFLKTLCLGITVAALQNLPMTTAFADSAISKTKIISKSDRENLVATVARTVQVSYKIDKNTIIEVTRFTDIDANDVKSVNIDYFDQRIISLVSRIPISVGELTADVLKAISAPVSDWYVMKRIEALLKKGVLQVVIPNKIFYNTIVQLNEE